MEARTTSLSPILPLARTKLVNATSASKGKMLCWRNVRASL